MTKFETAQDRDANFVPLSGDFPFRTKKSITFAGATTNAWGDDGGTLDGGAIFTVTGVVQIKILGEVTTNLAGGGALIEVGISGDTAIFMPQETETNLDAGMIWLNEGTPAAYYIIGEEEAAADKRLWLMNWLSARFYYRVVRYVPARRIPAKGRKGK